MASFAHCFKVTYSSLPLQFLCDWELDHYNLLVVFHHFSNLLKLDIFFHMVISSIPLGFVIATKIPSPYHKWSNIILLSFSR